MNRKRKIAVITGSRAEYGLLYWIIKGIFEDPALELQLIVTGMHLSSEFGLTVGEIKNDGFPISEKVEMLLSSDTESAISISMGVGIIGFAKAYERLRPDIIVVLGDRFEILSAVVSAVPFRIPIAHIHGGEITEGAIDELFRHAISKMSYLHFTSTEEYRKRIIQLGESPERVFYVGAVGLDNILRLPLLSREELEKKLNIRFNKHNLLVTYHPTTLEGNRCGKEFKCLLDVLNELNDTFVIFTKTNADTNGRIINDMIDSYVSANPNRSIVFTSMNRINYLSVMKEVDAVVGNSSSGIIEAPSFHVGTINIGNRQSGRVKAGNVIDCKPNKKELRKAFKKVFSVEFRNSLKKITNPYYCNGFASQKIIEVLKKFPIEKYNKKPFYNIQFHLKDEENE